MRFHDSFLFVHGETHDNELREKEEWGKKDEERKEAEEGGKKKRNVKRIVRKKGGGEESEPLPLDSNCKELLRYSGFHLTQ